MTLPGIPVLTASATALATWGRQLTASIAAGWNVEHRADGRHAWTVVRPAFDANRFRGTGSLVWTVASGNVYEEWYTRQGDLLTWSLTLSGGSTSGSGASHITVALPNTQWTWRAGGYWAAAFALDNGASVQAHLIAVTGSNLVTVRRYDAGNWNAASSNTAVRFTIHGLVNPGE